MRVLVVAGMRLHREGIAVMIEQRRGLAVLATAEPRHALAAARATHPDVVLVDVTIPASAQAIGEIAAALPGERLLALGVTEGQEEMPADAEAGIVGCVSREAPPEHLADAIRRAARNQPTCSRVVTAALTGGVSRRKPQNPGAIEAPLTRRELEVIALIDQGLSNKQIARRLCIELATVKNHVHHILEKLRVHRRGEAAARIRTRHDREYRLTPG